MKQVKDYLKELEKKGASPNSLKAYSATLSLFFRFLDGKEPSAERAQEFLDDLLANGSKPRPIGRHAAALKRATSSSWGPRKAESP